RLAGVGAIAVEDPVVASGAGIAAGPAGVNRPLARLGSPIARMQDALLIDLRQDEIAIEWTVVDGALDEVWDRDDREAARQVPAKFADDRQAIGLAPRFRLVSEQVEFDWQASSALFHQRVDTSGVGGQEPAHVRGQGRPFLLGDLAQTDRAMEQVRLD